MGARVVESSLGPVEVMLSAGAGPVVLVFPGGHTTADTAIGTDLYSELGYRVLTFSRPGYGQTRVGNLGPAEFVNCALEVCERLAVDDVAACAGVSLGGLQAAHVAVYAPSLAPRLILHSCAPSALPYPDKRLERVGAPLLFGRRVQKHTWRAVRAIARTDRGLQTLMGALSQAPTRTWWGDWTKADRESARSTFAGMDSGSGFLLDLHHSSAVRSPHREALLRRVACPTLVTASHADKGVSYAHAENFRRLIPRVTLVETGAPSHFYWLGSSRPVVLDAVRRHLNQKAM